MLTKDSLDMNEDVSLPSRDEQIYYVPRVASGKKRGVILNWAIPNRMQVLK